MKVSISQPTLFPWIGYFNMIHNSDVFVFLDNVKFKKQSWHMRNRLKIASKIEDSEIWIRIPTKSAKSNTLIKEALIDNDQDWRQKHLDIFQTNYGKDFKEIKFLEELYLKEWKSLGEFNMEFITKCCQYLDITTKLVCASDLNVEGKKSHLVLDICKKLGATEFIPNNGSRTYLENDEGIFQREQIKVSYHSYNHKIYNQKGNQFLQNLSVLDLLFSEFKNAKNFL